MIIELKGAMLIVQDGYTSAVADVPQECTYCHVMTQFFENRWGETRCLSCAIQKEKAA